VHEVEPTVEDAIALAARLHRGARYPSPEAEPYVFTLCASCFGLPIRWTRRPPCCTMWLRTTVNGLDQSSLATGGPVEADDERSPGQQNGWHVTMVTTQFTSGANTLPTTALTLNGSGTSASSSAAPVATCVGSCTTPTGNTVTYPVTIPTSAPTSVYSAASRTGTGIVDLATNFWLRITSSAVPGTYTATATIAIAAGP
jgi:hypothetical protein